jgi:NADH-quinone oxidoreductase subunit M
MLLAGVVMKLGAYGVLRVAVPLFPEGFHAWSGIFAGLAVIGVIYGGFVALVQKDLKFVIGYSSVSHMGFVILGIAAATPKAVAGSVLQMFSHGVIAGLLFAVVGRMVYDRTHTRELSALTTMGLNRAMPFAAVTFVIAGLASMGMPGFSGFPAELSILVGTWATRPLLVLVAAAGIVLAAAFTLRAVHVTFFPSGATTIPDHPLEPITLAEKCGAALLIAATIVVGLHPDLLLDMIVPALNDPLMARMFEGGAP